MIAEQRRRFGGPPPAAVHDVMCMIVESASVDFETAVAIERRYLAG
jgi:hypothetical protein